MKSGRAVMALVRPTWAPAALRAAQRGQPVDRAQAAVLARFVLEALDLASVSPEPHRVFSAAFTLLRQGWPDGQ